MSSLTIYGFRPDNLLKASHPIGKTPENGRERDPIQVLEIETGFQGQQIHRGKLPDNTKANVVSTDLRDIAQVLNRSIPIMFAMDALNPHQGLNQYKDGAQRFVTELNTLIQKRNDKIDASGWIAFLDVVLKILTLGLFSYKESLKAPMLNPTHWANACNPIEFKFTVDATFAKKQIPVDSPKSIERFLTATLPPVPTAAAPLQEDQFNQDIQDPQVVDKQAEFMTNLLVDRLPQDAQNRFNGPILEHSRWNDQQIDELLRFGSKGLQKSSELGVLVCNTSRALANLKAVDDLFNMGIVSSGVIVCTNRNNSRITEIAIRKTEGGEYALLVLGDSNQRNSYRVGYPLSSEAALSGHARVFDNSSISFIPQGPLHFTAPKLAEQDQQ